ncbi:MAG: DUF2992 family protein [Sphaerochaeta sp.]|nr:DUF2992 family protein [Sphaerochaeta sp.]
MDNFTICNIFFDGQFWIAIITRLQDGEYHEARYTFGPEPTGPEILQWSDSILPTLPFVKVEKPTALKKILLPSCSRVSSKDRYKEANTKHLKEKQKIKHSKKQMEKKLQYQSKKENEKKNANTEQPIFLQLEQKD